MKTIEELLQEATQKIQDVKDSSSLNDLRVLYLGKKGPVQELMKGMKDLSKECRLSGHLYQYRTHPNGKGIQNPTQFIG